MSLINFFDVMDPVRVLVEVLKRSSEKATKEKETYSGKLETATGDDVFKYVLLINISALEAYVAQTRIQAAQSFRLSQIVAVVGFLLMAAGVSMGMHTSLSGKQAIEIAYLSAGVDLLTEFISGVFFYLYNRTLQQINLFHDRLVAMQQTSMSFLASSLVAHATKRDNAKIQLSRDMLSLARPKSEQGAEV